MSHSIQHKALEIVAQRLARGRDQTHLSGTHRDSRVGGSQEVVDLGDIGTQSAYLIVAGNQLAALQRRADRVPAVDDQNVRPALGDVAGGGAARRPPSYHYGIPVDAGRLHGLSSGATGIS